MKKCIILSMLAFVLVISSLGVAPKKADADYADNYSRLYYDLARLVYDARDHEPTLDSIEAELNNLHAPVVNGVRQKKFVIISAVDVDSLPYHDMSRNSQTGFNEKMQNTGFKAMAVRVVGSNKVFVAFSGTDSNVFSIAQDAKTAAVTLSVNNPGQAYQAQLFLNYLVKGLGYSGKDFYLTGHSLGGWISSKLYLDVRAARWLTPSTSKFSYGGPISANIEGVYNFNPLPIGKSQIDDTGQWDANKNQVYNADVKNLFINNEWLNGVADMHPSTVDYIGVEGSVNKSLPYYTSLNYQRNSSASTDLVEYYYFWNSSSSVRVNHGLEFLKPHTYY